MKLRLPAYLRSSYFVRIAVLTFLCASASSIVSTYLSVFLAQRVGANAAQIGIFVSLSSLSGLVIGTVIARYTDKHDKRKGPLALAILCAIFGYSLYAVFTNFWLLLIVAITLIGVSTTITSQLFAYAKQIFDAHDAPESAITIMRTCISVAWVTSPLLGASLYAIYGFTGLLGGAVAGFAASLVMLLGFFHLDSTPGIDPAAGTSGGQRVPQREATWVIASYFVVFVLLHAINTVINTNLPLYVTETLGHANEYVGVIMSVSALLEIPLMLLLATLSTRFNVNYLIGGGILSIIVFLALIPFTRSIHIIVAMQLLKAFFCASFMGLGISFFQAMIPKQYGLSTVLFTNTTRVGTIVAGGITAVSGNRYSDAFFVLLVTGLLSLLLFAITPALGRRASRARLSKLVHRGE